MRFLGFTLLSITLLTKIVTFKIMEKDIAEWALKVWHENKQLKNKIKALELENKMLKEKLFGINCCD